MALARVRGPGHPDQVCDLVAASIAEEYVRRDPMARTNIRVCGGHEVMFIAGEVSSTADFDVSAVVRRALGGSGVTSTVEPFIAIEPMPAVWTQALGTREAETVVGYATQETPEYLPKAAAAARDLARALERLRTLDEEWFWLGADYEILVDEQPQAPLVVIRAQHVDTHPVSRVRERLTAFVRTRLAKAEVRVNAAGEETQAGLAKRMGSSGRSGAAWQYGSLLPSMASGTGFHPVHPLNAGAWLARSLAREAVRAGHGQAVMAHMTWFPLETRPALIRLRNERGRDVGEGLSVDACDLMKLPSAWLAPSLITQALRSPFDGSVSLPWEEEKGS